jgi:hypothetical protein
MQIAALCHAEVAEELAAFLVEVVDELVAESLKQDERWLLHMKPGVRVRNLLIGQPSHRAWLADRLEEAAGRLVVEQAARWVADTELEALRSSTARVRDLVLERADRPSSLVTSLSSAEELLKGHIDAVTSYGVRWGTQSALVVTLSHVPELGAKLELLGSGLDADLIVNQVDALWTQVCPASDLLALYVPSSAACGPLDVAGE